MFAPVSNPGSKDKTIKLWDVAMWQAVGAPLWWGLIFSVTGEHIKVNTFELFDLQFDGIDRTWANLLPTHIHFVPMWHFENAVIYTI